MSWIKAHQKAPIRNELKWGLFFLFLLTIAFGSRVIPINLSTPQLVTSFLAFVMFVGLYVLQANPPLSKALHSRIESTPNWVICLPLIIWAMASLYAVATAQATVTNTALGLGYCMIPALLMIPLMRRSPALQWLDVAVILLLWFPIEFGWTPKIEIPPIRSVLNLYHVIGIVLATFLYFSVRHLPETGFTYRFKSVDIRIAIQNFIIFMPFALIIGFATDFIAVSQNLPGPGHMLARFLAIFFFIAIPEEILFRGVIHNLIEKRLALRKNGMTWALVISSIIFGLAHGDNHNPPFLNIDLGPLGVWQAPWVYIILASIAGYFYGLTFIKTRKITAAALVHLLVDWFWSIFFSG